MKLFSKFWISSTKREKQRKFRAKAPLHIRGKFLSARLGKSTKLKMRSLGLRVGDKVKVMRGQFKKKEGVVERVDRKNEKIFITGIERFRKEGTKSLIPIHPSNLMILELEGNDKKRIKK